MKRRKILSVVLSACLAFGSMGSVAYAEEKTEADISEEIVVEEFEITNQDAPEMEVDIEPVDMENIPDEVSNDTDEEASDLAEPTSKLLVSGNPYPTYNYYNSASDYQIACTWYAWKQANERLGLSLPSWGNGGSWYSNAGYPKGSEPKVNSIACWSASNSPSYGHVAYVTGVNSDGSFNIVEGGSGWSGNDHGICSRTVKAGRYWPDQGFIYLQDAADTTQKGAPIDGGSQTISDGDYHIVSALNTNMGIDVAGNGNTDGTNVQLWNNIDDSNQVFTVQYLNNGFYKITHKSSGKVLDVYGGSLDYGTNVNIYGSNDTDAQKWRIDEAGDNHYFYIKAKCNGLCLDVDNGTASDGTNIKVYGSNGSDAQKWAFVAVGGGQPISNGNYHIVSALNNNSGIDVAGNSSENDTNIQLYSNVNDDNQVITVTYIGNGYYKLTQASSGKSLDMYGGCSVAGTNIQLYDWNNSNAQKWILKDAGNGYYYIIVKCGGLFVDVSGGSTQNNTNIQGFIGNGTNSQKWKFVKTHTHTLTKTNAKAATCTEAGNSAYWTCSSCGKYFSDANGTTEISKDSWVIAAKGHDWGEWVITKAATETAEGVKTRTCKNDASHTETQTIPKTTHVHSLTKTAAKAATCTEAGNSAYWTCSGCGKYFSDANGTKEISKDSWVIKATGHDFSNNAEYCKNGCGTKNPDYKDSGNELIDISDWEVEGLTNLTYTGKEVKHNNKIKVHSEKGEYAKITYSYRNNINAGTALIIIKGKGNYTGTISKNFQILKAKNTFTKVTSKKTLKAATLKKKKQTFTIAATVKENAKKTYKLTSFPSKAKKYISVSSAGKVTVKKGLAKGTYTIKVKITAAATANYKKTSKTVSVKITVK